MTISPETTVGYLATEFPETIRVFQRLRIEFCCDGPRPLGELCRERGLSFENVASALGLATPSPHAPDSGWQRRAVIELTAHITEAFHDPLRTELPRLHALAVRAQNHGQGSEDVHRTVLQALERLRATLETHMEMEERELFPLVARLEAGAIDGRAEADVSRLRAALQSDHKLLAGTLSDLRRVTHQYEPPSHACSTVRTLYRGLDELEKLMHLHIHLENNVLFTRAAALLPEAGIERSL